MRIVGRSIGVLLSVVIGFTLAGPVRAQVTGSTATNSQAGDNRATTNQGGSGKSGNAVGGQVSGVVASGRASVDGKNTSSNSSIQSGDVGVTNSSSSFTGLNATTGATGSASNTQVGNNNFRITQAADGTTSGDGVAGQIIGVVTEAGGSANVVASDVSDNNDVQTGESTSDNSSIAFVGLNASPTAVTGNSAVAINTQTGNNRLSVDQTALSNSGNGVAGQVIGVVSAGTTSVDANNTSSNNDVNTVFQASANSLSGDGPNGSAFVGLDAQPSATGTTSTASASNTQVGNNRGTITQFAPGTTNSSTLFVGLDSDPTAFGPVTATAVATNNQTGNNAFTLGQTAPTSTASIDSVAGQIIGDVTGAGGSASIVAKNLSDNNSVENVGVAGQVVGAVTSGIASIDAANSSTNNDVIGGITNGVNSSNAFVGLDADASATGGAGATVGAATSTALNTQDGNNRGTVNQSASTSGGMPVAGQIIGDVTTSGASSSIVASNTSDNNSVETGRVDAINTSDAFIGLDASATEAVINATTAAVINNQIGDDRFTLTESASATSGNGVAGEVLGVVSSGATSLDAGNTSKDNNVETGAAAATDTSGAQVGLAATEVGPGLGSNIQSGNDRKSLDQTSAATSGDAVAGQVAGVVTSAGGSSSVVVANTSTGIDATSGESTFDNTDHAFVGQNVTTEALTI